MPRALGRITTGSLIGRVLGALLVASVCAASGDGRARADTAPLGNVEDISGQAQARQKGETRALAPAEPVFTGDLVRTMAASRLTMRLASTVIKLGADTELQLESYLAQTGGVLELATGALGFETPEGAEEGDWQIKSDYGVIAVRGTRFFAGPSRGVFGVFVERGAVEVTAAGQSVRLTAGQGTNIAAPGEPPSAPAPWGEARIAEAWQSVE